MKSSVWSFLLFWNEGSLMKKHSPLTFESHAKTTWLNFANSPSSIFTRSEIYFPPCLRANGEEEMLTGQLSNWSLGKRAPWGNFWWSSKTTTSLDQMLRERETKKEMRRERQQRQRGWPVSTQAYWRSVSQHCTARRGEERMEQLNNRKRLRERQWIYYRVSAKTISCVTGNDTAGQAKGENVGVYFVW